MILVLLNVAVSADDICTICLCHMYTKFKSSITMLALMGDLCAGLKLQLTGRCIYMLDNYQVYTLPAIFASLACTEGVGVGGVGGAYWL